MREVRGSPFEEFDATPITHSLADVKLLIPVIPPTFYCLGVNYALHVEERARSEGRAPVYPSGPEIGYRSNAALIAHEEPIVKPADASDEFQYEGELAVVFGRRAKNVAKEDALDCVFGWTIGNDVTERSWQRKDKTFWRSKNSDTFKPMGPWIATGLDPRDMTTAIRVNGRTMEEFSTGNMLFDVATCISTLTRYVTIQPGDVMWMGTDGLPKNIAPGDIVEIAISGIGALRNPVTQERMK